MLKIQPDGSYRHNPVYSFAGKHTSGKIYSDQLEQALGKARAKGETLNTYHHDVAYAAQEMLEHAILGIAENVFKQSGFSGNLCLAGGVALNCKANGVLAEHPAIKNLFVPPVASDDGTALGAALLLAKNKGLNPRISLPHAYWGPAYNDSDIETELRSSGLAYKYVVDIAVYAAQSLAQGKIIGWFQGSMEVGARALGNRSILAHPAISGMKDKVNLEIKNRENWRPFAASILDHAAHRMVQHSKHSPFMTIAFHCTDEAQKLIPEALHVDGTTRPQFVIPEANPLYYHLLTEFEKLTGIAALLNTSFNGHEEPIVCTPQQAINTFKATGLDSLAIGNFWVDKRSEILS
jgi:carbamoyltransferase